MRRIVGSGVVALGLSAALLGGCAYYPAAPYTVTQPRTFDRAYDAALGAMSDQGLRITAQDRARGHIVGTNGNATVTASVRPQADGTTRVAFDISGEGDSNLSQRVLASYNARMGR